MDRLAQDVRHAVRMLWKAPGFTIAAVAALALGIGANTAVFSVLNTVLLKPLPYPDPDRMMVFLNTSPQGSGPGASPTKFNLWRRQAAFQDVSAYRFNIVNLTSTGDPEQISAGQVSSGFFSLFGAPIAEGRTFTADEDLPNAAPVVVLSHGFWSRRFGGDAGMVGRTVSLNGQPHLVLGILGPFDTGAIEQGTGSPDVWLPFQIDPNSTMQGHFFLAAGRLTSGVTVEAATAQLQQAAGEFRETFPTALGPQGSFGIRPLADVVVFSVRSSLWLLAGAVSLVLLIACANVASLLLVRANVRQREIAIRAAIGAGRRRIVGQLLTESVVLSLLGGALGLVFGLIGIRALLALNPGNIPRIGVGGTGVAIDGRVLLFTVAVSVITGLVFGLLPAWHASRTDLSSTMKEGGGRSGTGFRQNKARALLVVSEMGLALVLLVGAALLIRTYVALRAVNPGFDAHQVLTMRMSLKGERFATAAAVGELIRDGAERLQSIPGVEGAGATCCVPLEGGLGLPFTIEGRPLIQGPFHGGGGFTPTSPTYFGTFKIPIVRGRNFTYQDGAGAPGVVVINQRMARQYWPDSEPLGARITIGKGLGPAFEEGAREIVGIVGDVRDGALNRDPQPIMYVPWVQLPDAHSANLVDITPMAWVVRTRGEPYALSGQIQQVLRDASGGLPVARLRTMEEIIGRATARSDFNMSLLIAFAISALVLAAIGVYGLMAYSVQQRTQEIGIRLALGADAPRVRNMVVRQGMTVVLVGVVAGLAVSFGVTRLMATFLFGVTARDPLVFGIVPIILTLVALIGVWLPARRAARVDPVVALRTE